MALFLIEKKEKSLIVWFQPCYLPDYEAEAVGLTLKSHINLSNGFDFWKEKTEKDTNDALNLSCL